VKIVRTRHYWNGSTGRDVLGDATPTITHNDDGSVVLEIRTDRGEETAAMLTPDEIALLRERADAT
jgi:hypothetical protein